MMERLRESKWVYMLLSILLAVIFWMYVRVAVDPTQPGTIYNVPVEVTGTGVLNSQGLAVSSISVNTVTLRVEASTSVLNNLSHKNVSAVVDVSRCVAGENTLTYTPRVAANVNSEGAVWVGQTPDTITVVVEKLDMKSFDIEFQLQGSVAKGYQAGTAAIEPETVFVSGPMDQVSQVAKVVAVLEADELSEQFSGNLPLKLLNAAGEELTDLEVTLDSNSAYVVLPVGMVKEIPLTVNFLPGGGATEDDISYCKIEPETITVAGSEADIQELTELSLGSVALADVVGSSTITLPVALDPSLENVSGITTATVTVTVSGLSTRTFEVDNIVLANKSDGYTMNSVTQVRSIVVRGKEEDLDAIDASQLRIVADMSDITTVGTYSVPVKVYLNAAGSVGVIGEYSIIVDISR